MTFLTVEQCLELYPMLRVKDYLFDNLLMNLKPYDERELAWYDGGFEVVAKIYKQHRSKAVDQQNSIKEN